MYFSLSYWHMTRNKRKFGMEIIKHCSGNILDYRGGIEYLCLKLVEKGLNVALAEINEKNMEFVRWIFLKQEDILIL